MTTQQGMKWYKFLIYFSLIFSAVLNLGSCILYFTGEVHNVGNSNHIDLEWFYTFFKDLKARDVFMGVACLILVALAIITEIFLVKFKKAGPVLLYVTIIINIVTSIAYLIGTVVIIGNVAGQVEIQPSDITSIVTSIVMLILNIIYFNKRKHLFTK